MADGLNEMYDIKLENSTKDKRVDLDLLYAFSTFCQGTKKRVEIQFSVRREEKPRVRKERKFLTFRSHTTFVTKQNFENQDDSVSIFDDSVGKDDSSLRKQLSLLYLTLFSQI